MLVVVGGKTMRGRPLLPGAEEELMSCPAEISLLLPASSLGTMLEQDSAPVPSSSNLTLASGSGQEQDSKQLDLFNVSADTAPRGGST